LNFFLAVRCGGRSFLGGRNLIGTHVAVALENGTFLDDELLGLDVAHELGGVFENELSGAVDIALDGTGDDRGSHLDFAFYTARAFHDEVAFDIDAALDVAGNADVALAEDITLDGDAVTNLRDFLFFIRHVFS